MVLARTALLLFFLLLASTQGFSAGNTGADSLQPKLFIDPNGVRLPDLTTLKNQQLVELIDSLLETGKLSPTIIAAINTEVKKRQNASAPTCKPVFTPPASELYKGWDNLTIFPFDETPLPVDTTVLMIFSKKAKYHPPVKGVVTSDFGWRDSSAHNGIDIDLNTGDKVYAAFEGVVRIARKHATFGKVIVIRHYNGLETLYGHLSKIQVSPGQKVTAGQVIGNGGNTGRSTGSHLHFETRFKSVPINPNYFISFKDHKLNADTFSIKKSRFNYSVIPYNAKTYTVKKGDSLYEIALKYGLTVARLAEINGISRRRPVKVGQVLRVA